MRRAALCAHCRARATKPIRHLARIPDTPRHACSDRIARQDVSVRVPLKPLDRIYQMASSTLTLFVAYAHSCRVAATKSGRFKMPTRKGKRPTPLAVLPGP